MGYISRGIGVPSRAHSQSPLSVRVPWGLFALESFQHPESFKSAHTNANYTLLQHRGQDLGRAVRVPTRNTTAVGTLQQPARTYTLNYKSRRRDILFCAVSMGVSKNQGP